MIIALLGASGSGKSLVEKKIAMKLNYSRIIPYTTRTPRTNEINGEDYFFITNLKFENAINDELFAEYYKYPKGRSYGTLKADYCGDKIVSITPDGLRQIKRYITKDNIFSIYIKANLGTRVKRYIERCGIKEFDYSDMEEISSRVNRDYGMFLGIEREVNMVIENNEGDDIETIVQKIIKDIEKVQKEKCK